MALPAVFVKQGCSRSRRSWLRISGWLDKAGTGIQVPVPRSFAPSHCQGDTLGRYGAPATLGRKLWGCLGKFPGNLLMYNGSRKFIEISLVKTEPTVESY